MSLWLHHFHRLMPEYGGKLAYGAVAYLKADERAAVYTEKQGLFVIRATGSSASMTYRWRAQVRRHGYAHATDGGRRGED